MKYIVTVKLNTNTELVFKVSANDSREAVSKVMLELTEIQGHCLTSIQVREEKIYKEL